MERFLGKVSSPFRNREKQRTTRLARCETQYKELIEYSEFGDENLRKAVIHHFRHEAKPDLDKAVADVRGAAVPSPVPALLRAMDSLRLLMKRMRFYALPSHLVIVGLRIVRRLYLLALMAAGVVLIIAMIWLIFEALKFVF